jgi:hypothetical protein
MNTQSGSRDLVDGRVKATANARTPYFEATHHISTTHKARFVGCTLILLNPFVLKIILVFRIDYFVLLCHLIYLITD